MYDGVKYAVTMAIISHWPGQHVFSKPSSETKVSASLAAATTVALATALHLLECIQFVLLARLRDRLTYVHFL